MIDYRLIEEELKIIQQAMNHAAEGVEGLKNRPKSGRPAKADESYCAALEETLAAEPSDYGYAFAFWTADRLREHLRQKTGIKLSNRRFRDLLKRKGYV